MHGRKSKPLTRPEGQTLQDTQGRAGSPLPAARQMTRDGAHGVTRPTAKLPAFLTAQPDGVLLAIKLQPRASKNEIGEPLGAELRIKVTAPPVNAAANEALIRLLAETLDCPRGKVELIRGHTSRHKAVKIQGTSAHEILSKLEML
jgi:uncharacterized protein